jgi:aminoglycoside 6'-N-acetyltransferase
VTVLEGDEVVLRPATEADVATLAAIRSTPEVHARWGGPLDDMEAKVRESMHEEGVTGFAVTLSGEVVGWIQCYDSGDPDTWYAGIDVYLAPHVHGRGLGTDAVRTLARHLVDDLGHHRLVIDPAADNEAAIASYRKVGFRPVGVMRRYERGPDGTWHDNLLMELLADELS